MCTYVVYSSVHLSVRGPVIWVHFRSRANTPRNDGMEGDHILSFNYREVALSRQMLGRNYAKNPRVPFRTSSPVALEWWNEWYWYLADDFQFVLLMSVSAFSQLWAIIIHLYKLITMLKQEIWVLFVVIPIYFAFEQHVPEDQGFVSSCSSITKTVRKYRTKKLFFQNSFILVTITIIFGCKFCATFSEVNSRGYSKFEWSIIKTNILKNR